MGFLKQNVKKFFKIKLVLESFKVLFFRVTGVLILFGFIIFLTNNYSAEIVGRYDFIRSFLLVVGSFCLLGTDQSILYFSGKLRSNNQFHRIKSIYYKMLKMVFLTSFIVLLIMIFLGKNLINNFFQDDGIYATLIKSALILFFYCLTILNTEIFRALTLISLSEIFRNIIKYIPIVFGAVLLLLIERQEFLISFYLFGFIFLGVISTFITIHFLKKLPSLASSEINLRTKEIALKSYPMALSGMAFFLLMSLDIILLKKYRGDIEVAYYGVAVKLLMILSMIINAININASARIAELYNGKKIMELKLLLRQSSRLIAFLSLPFVIIIIIYAENILNIFGENYVASKEALRIMILSQGICTLFGSVTVYFNMTGRQKTFQHILTGAVLINLVLNVLLIPRYGMIGASIAFSASLFFWNILSVILVYKRDRIKIFLS